MSSTSSPTAAQPAGQVVAERLVEDGQDRRVGRRHEHGDRREADDDGPVGHLVGEGVEQQRAAPQVHRRGSGRRCRPAGRVRPRPRARRAARVGAAAAATASTCAGVGDVAGHRHGRPVHRRTRPRSATTSGPCPPTAARGRAPCPTPPRSPPAPLRPRPTPVSSIAMLPMLPRVCAERACQCGGAEVVRALRTDGRPAAWVSSPKPDRRRAGQRASSSLSTSSPALAEQPHVLEVGVQQRVAVRRGEHRSRRGPPSRRAARRSRRHGAGSGSTTSARSRTGPARGRRRGCRSRRPATTDVVRRAP